MIEASGMCRRFERNCLLPAVEEPHTAKGWLAHSQFGAHFQLYSLWAIWDSSIPVLKPLTHALLLTA